MWVALVLDELLARLDADERPRGMQFEPIVKWFLTHAPEHRGELRSVWLYESPRVQRRSSSPGSRCCTGAL